jgi:PAS domain S-box-containing protein
VKRSLKDGLNAVCLSISVLSFWIYIFAKVIDTFAIDGFKEKFDTDLVELVCFLVMMPTLGLSVKYIITKNRKEYKKNKYESEILKLRMSAIDKSNAVIEFNPHGYVLSVNKKFIDIFGYNSHKIVGKHHSLLMPAGIKESNGYKRFWADLRKGEHKHGEFHRKDIWGNDVYIVGTYVPIWNKKRNEVSKILKLAQDNTDKYKAFELLHNKNIYLEHAAKILRHDMHSGINT